MNPFNAGCAVGLLVAPLLLTWMTNWQRRGTVFFGVTVEPGFGQSEAAGKILTRFRQQVWALAALITVLIVLPHKQYNMYIVLTLVGVYSVALVAIFAAGWSRAKAYAAKPQRVRSISLREAEAPIPTSVKILTQLLTGLALLLPVAMIVSTAYFVAAHAGQIPASFPVRWSDAGQPTAWSAHTFNGLYGNLMAAGAFYLGALFVFLAFQYRSRVSDWSGSAKINRYYQQAMQGWILLFCFLCSAMLCADALVPVYANHPLPWVHVDVKIVRFGILITLDLVLLGLFGFGYWARKRYGSAHDVTPDECWKWGQFYVNGSDPALVVPKRCGFGYTINLGHRITWVFMALAIVMIAAPLWVGR
ncbi:MAG: DUF5808 domain-containing protein [Acidobacteriaceae bacterium]